MKPVILFGNSFFFMTSRFAIVTQQRQLGSSEWSEYFSKLYNCKLEKGNIVNRIRNSKGIKVKRV